jgi:DNA-binding response OmpR family regulator
MSAVLIIDDDELMLNITREILEDEGYKVYATADGPRGIELYREYRPPLVLLDLGLPTMGGLEVLSAIRTIDAGATVVIVSGYVSPEARERAAHLGVTTFIEKGIHIEELVGKIRGVLRSLGKEN